MPLIAKYDLHLFNICRNAQKLSEELARQYLNEYMFSENQEKIKNIDGIIDFFMNHEHHKSHGRSIDRETAKKIGLTVINSEDIKIDSLLLSLFNQYHLFFAQSPFYKLFENPRGVNWGRAIQQFQIPPVMPNQQLMPIQ